MGAMILNAGRVLLVRHAKPGREPYWVLPGGRLEAHETIPECAEREVREEVGLDGSFREVVFVSEFLHEGRHTVDITARVAASGEAELGGDPELAPGSEPTLREVRWVTARELQGLNLLPRKIKEKLLQDILSPAVAIGSGSGRETEREIYLATGGSS